MAYEHRDLAEAIEEVLKPVGESIGRMQWKGPHRDRVQSELGTVTRTVRTVAEVLRDRAQLIEKAAAQVPDGSIVKDAWRVLEGPTGWGTIAREHFTDPLVPLRTLHQQLTPMGPTVAEFFAEHGIR
ncbi:MAG: hypothetical protein IRZ07_04055 [Microbispora sp.]|nr:hypothetical protein [Microbispora sp.]